ncbi:MAG: transporter [Ignavibacteria bacterium]|nr:transporter [Ignavibacteria bacterium]
MRLFKEISESLRMALTALYANKLRSFLASLGVVIGISFVILMGWALDGLDHAMADAFKALGADMLYVDKWDWAGGRRWDLIRQRKPITIEQGKELVERLQTPELAYMYSNAHRANFKCKDKAFTGISVNGTGWQHSQTPMGSILEGRHFSIFEAQQSARVAVIGYNVNAKIFPEGGAIGTLLKINGIDFTIIGVAKKQGTAFFDFLDNEVHIPFGAFIKIFGRERSVGISVKAGSEENMERVKSEIRGLMRSIRNLKPNQEDDFSINELKAFDEILNEMRKYIWGAGIGMTILSFIVGIIGIMNIMFVSVTERTKEIGIRKAIGARKSSIWYQFIIESSVLCIAGSIFSLILCSIIVYLAATFLPDYWPKADLLSPYLPYQLLFIASIVSIFVGIIAGLVPAIRAANLDPVDALRYE